MNFRANDTDQVRFYFVILCLLISACSEPATPALTKIVLVIDTDFEVPSDINFIEVSAEGDSLNEPFSEFFKVGGQDQMTPVIVALSNTGSDLDPLNITVVGTRNGTPIVTRTLTLGFVRGESRRLDVNLSTSCFDLGCASNQQCVMGCPAQDTIDPDGLPLWTDTDASVPDAGISDLSLDDVDSLDMNIEDRGADDVATPDPDAQPDGPILPTCNDGVMNGSETDVDCGGADCAACGGCSEQSDMPASECQALESIHAALGGTNWVQGSDWLSNDSPCSWTGITCGNASVTKIEILEDNLSGQLPAALGNFPNLFILTIQDANTSEVTGSIPPEIGNLTSMQRIDFRSLGLTGTVPTEIGALTDLRSIDVRQNQLSGAFPSSIANCTMLQGISAFDNAFESIPSEMFDLTATVLISFSGNQLTGTLPTNVSNSTSLRTLRLDRNQMSGPLPDTLMALPAIETLTLGNNGCFRASAALTTWLNTNSPVWDNGC